MGLLVLLNFTAVVASELLKQAGATARKVNEFLTVTGGAVSQMEEAVYSGPKDPNDVAIRPAGVFGGILPPCPLMLDKREGAFR